MNTTTTTTTTASAHSVRAPTAMQWTVMGFLYAFHLQEDRLPTRAEISGHFGWRSVNAADTHITFLIAKGLIEKRGFHIRFARTEKGREALATLAAAKEAL